MLNVHQTSFFPWCLRHHLQPLTQLGGTVVQIQANRMWAEVKCVCSGLAPTSFRGHCRRALVSPICQLSAAGPMVDFKAWTVSEPLAGRNWGAWMTPWSRSPHCPALGVTSDTELYFVKPVGFKIARGGCCCCLPSKSCLTFASPRTVARRALLSMGFPRQDTGVGCHFLFQAVFQTQKSNSYFPALTGRFFFLPLSHQESPERVANLNKTSTFTVLAIIFYHLYHYRFNHLKFTLYDLNLFKKRALCPYP